MSAVQFISEVSSNHHQDIDRCIEFIRQSSTIGCHAVKFQLFKIEELFAPEVLSKSAAHRERRDWELPTSFLPKLRDACNEYQIEFSCTPFYLEAVEQLEPFVDFYKIASYELLWDNLITACAQTKKPLILSTGMATLDEILHAVDVFKSAGGIELTLLHCVSGYPVQPEYCNLSAIDTIRSATGQAVGWSDHSRDPAIIQRAIHKYDVKTIEFHLDLDEEGAEYKVGHCWLPDEIKSVIDACERIVEVDGDGVKKPTQAEMPDCLWRADPADGLRPFMQVRREWAKK